MIEVKLPQWGMGMQEGTVLEWLVKVGDMVDEGQALVSIEAEKVTSEVESPVAGTIEELLVAEEDVVTTFQTLVLIKPTQS